MIGYGCIAAPHLDFRIVTLHHVMVEAVGDAPGHAEKHDQHKDTPCHSYTRESCPHLVMTESLRYFSE